MKSFARWGLMLVTSAVIAAGAGGCASTPISASGEQQTSQFTLAMASSLAVVESPLADSAAEVTGREVLTTVDGTSTLIPQILEGKPTDILLSADEASVEPLIDAQLIRGEPVALARNQLVLAVPADNPAQVRSLNDLSRTDVRFVQCAVQVPCGRLAAQALKQAEITGVPLTETQNVAAAVGLIASGEADAGLVYATDVRTSNGKLVVIEDPRLDDATATVTGVVLATSTAANTARELLVRWASADFFSVWQDAGFLPVTQGAEQ